MSASFHNTTESTGAELARFERQAQNQEQVIARLFRARSQSAMTPSQVWGLLDTRAPLTSIRRAMTNLANAGVLVKTPAQVLGPYGKPEHRWVYNRRPEERIELFSTSPGGAAAPRQPTVKIHDQAGSILVPQTQESTCANP